MPVDSISLVRPFEIFTLAISIVVDFYQPFFLFAIRSLSVSRARRILKWLIDGAVKYWQAGCRIEVPESVRKATEEYRANEDWLKGFLSERCILDPDVRERAGLLYEEYQRYAQSIGEYCRRGSDFAKAMDGAGYKTVTVNGRKFYKGVAIRYTDAG